jgi:hypothetical protein
MVLINSDESLKRKKETREKLERRGGLVGKRRK